MFRQPSVAPTMTARRATVQRPANPDAHVEPAVAPAKTPSTDLGPIIRSKIQAPALRSTTLTRQRLIDQLTEATSHRLTLLIAEAGYGKTTLLADFARVSGMRTLWYRLDSSDAQIVDWANHLVAAAREHDPEFGSLTASLLTEIKTGGPPKEAFVSSVISELSSLDARPSLLVLDDFHLVDRSADAADFVKRLIRDAPPWLVIVVASRKRPDLELARVAAAGELAEIGTDDLRFTHEEVAQLFDSQLATPLDEDVLEALDQRTMGWAASLQLFHRSIQGKSPGSIRSLARALSGAESPVYDFLAEEVLGNLSPEMVDLLMRVSLLERVSETEVAALFADAIPPPSHEEAMAWIEDADRLGMLTRSSTSSDARHLHPLLRDFLRRQLAQRESEQEIRAMHRRVAVAMAAVDPLTSAQHFVNAGSPDDALHVLGTSVLLTVGSGRWGMASELVEKLAGIRADPAVAAIRARQLIESGDLSSAEELLEGFDVSDAPPDVRAAFRQTELSLGWRTGNRVRMARALSAIKRDPETPPVLYDIASVFLDASPLAAQPGRLPSVGQRLRDMALRMGAEGLTYFSAVAMHDSAVAFLNAGLYVAALESGSEALIQFSKLPYFAAEQLSTHTVMAICERELGNEPSSAAHAVAALSPGTEFADVPAELAFLATLTGDSDRASALATRAKLQQNHNRSDAVGDALLECAVAASELRISLDSAISRLNRAAFDIPLELGYSLERTALLAQALLLKGDDEEATRIAAEAALVARSRMARRAEARLGVIAAVARRDATELEGALTAAEGSGELALLEVADALLAYAELLVPIPSAVDRSIRSHPRRWLPGIRRQLESGNTPNARAAAALLDAYGTVDDVGLLRAYAKTYAKRGPGKNLGVALARRTSPGLRVHDLGRVRLSISDREVSATSMRRKAAAVLMFLVTRPGFVANREQIIDELWPESDPSSGTNNLNQSLYFLRRDVDPWYEDDLSLDYVRFQADLVWLETDLVSADSVEFVKQAQAAILDPADSIKLLAQYGGQFAPEFEYDEWALAWRTRVHSTFLELANATIDRLVGNLDLAAAARVASMTIQIDPEAADVERRLVWLYGRLGLESAARTQHVHLARLDAADGMEITPLSALLEGPLPEA